MNAATITHLLFTILTVLLFIPAATGQQTPAPYSPVPGGCAGSFISLSPCLPYISAPPNDLSDHPSSQCCDIFNVAIDSDDAECLCYLVRQNSLLGFTLNVTKLLSLSDHCSVNSNSQADHTDNSLESICSGSPTPPPLISTRTKPPSGSNAQRAPPPPPLTITKPTPATNVSTQNTTNPYTSEQSNNPDSSSEAFLWVFLLLYLYVFYIL